MISYFLWYQIRLLYLSLPQNFIQLQPDTRRENLQACCRWICNRDAPNRGMMRGTDRKLKPRLRPG
jgi:hypothetical protein